MPLLEPNPVSDTRCRKRYGIHAAGGASEDAESARLVALNMAMDRKSREETERYLAENFRLSDLRGLVDDVYSSFEA